MERWKAEQGRGIEKRKIRRKKIRRERVRRQKIQMREKVGKSRNTVCFQWFVAPEGRKVLSWPEERWKIARRCGAKHTSENVQNTPSDPFGSWDVKKCTPLWREAHFQVTKHTRFGTFGSCDVEKVHAVVARSTFPSQNTKHLSSGPLLEVEMSKKCTPLWREAHFQVKITKHTILGPLLEVEMSKKCTPLSFPSQKC